MNVRTKLDDNRSVRRLVASGLTLVFSGWLLVSGLIACPFLTAELQPARHACCPRSGPAPTCPVSQSLQDCPYFASESKIGMPEGVQAFVPLAAPVVLIPVSGAVAESARQDRRPDESGLLLRIHVLRI
jgi:hypothetical protein